MTKVEKLMKHIVAASQADSWGSAKGEWDLVDVYREEHPDTCLCSHSPILEICVLQNRKNRRKAQVGNVCVKKFFKIRSDLIFNCVRRLREDDTKSLNPDTIEYAFKKQIINKDEKRFCLATMRKRSSITPEDMKRRIRINHRVVKQILGRARVQQSR